MFFLLIESGWFWLVAWLIAGTICVAFDSDFILLAISIGILFAVKYLVGMNIFTVDMLWNILPWILAYVPCGILWSFFKWYCFLLDYKEYYLKEKLAHEKERLLHPKTESWEEYRTRHWRFSDKHMVSKNKAKICRWICYWPLSLVHSLFYDLIKKIGNIIYDCMGGSYDKITKWVLRDINE